MESPGEIVEFPSGVVLPAWLAEGMKNVTNYTVLADGNRGRHARGLSLTRPANGAKRMGGQAEGGFRPSARGQSALRTGWRSGGRSNRQRMALRAAGI